jgi:hypothetical protein
MVDRNTIYFNGNNKLKRNTLLPCSYDEYLGACNQELSDGGRKERKTAFRRRFYTTKLIL